MGVIISALNTLPFARVAVFFIAYKQINGANFEHAWWAVGAIIFMQVVDTLYAAQLDRHEETKVTVGGVLNQAGTMANLERMQHGKKPSEK